MVGTLVQSAQDTLVPTQVIQPGGNVTYELRTVAASGSTPGTLKIVVARNQNERAGGQSIAAVVGAAASGGGFPTMAEPLNEHLD